MPISRRLRDVEFRFRDTRRISRACVAPSFSRFSRANARRPCDIRVTAQTGGFVELVVYHSLFVKAAIFFFREIKGANYHANQSICIDSRELPLVQTMNHGSQIMRTVRSGERDEVPACEIPRRERNIENCRSRYVPLGNRSRGDEFARRGGKSCTCCEILPQT